MEQFHENISRQDLVKNNKSDLRPASFKHTFKIFSKFNSAVTWRHHLSCCRIKENDYGMFFFYFSQNLKYMVFTFKYKRFTRSTNQEP